MKNLDEALKNVYKEESDAIYNKIKSFKSEEDDLEWTIVDLIHQAAEAIGGYVDGSELFDKGDTYQMLSLLGQAGESEDYSIDYDDIPEIKEAYAEDIIKRMGDFNFAALKSFNEILTVAAANNLFDGTKEQLANVFCTSEAFANDVFGKLNQPRG